MFQSDFTSYRSHHKSSAFLGLLALILGIYGWSGCGETESPTVLDERQLQMEEVTASVTGQNVIIQWTTNLPANSQVEYGTTDGYGNFSALDAMLTTTHRVELTDLQPNVSYHFRVKSTTADGTARDAGDFHFIAGETSPILTEISAEPDAEQATIRWRMSESATVTVEYGTSPAFGEEATLSADAQTAYEIALWDLQPEATYHYRLIAEDLDGNVTTSEMFTLTTQAIPKEEVTEIQMTARQWQFTPQTITVTEGEKVRLTIRSTDVAHGFGLAQLGINEPLNPGQSVVVEFTANKEGNFPFRCTVNCGAGHNDMNGTLIVKAKP